PTRREIDSMTLITELVNVESDRIVWRDIGERIFFGVIHPDVGVYEVYESGQREGHITAVTRPCHRFAVYPGDFVLKRPTVLLLAVDGVKTDLITADIDELLAVGCKISTGISRSTHQIISLDHLGTEGRNIESGLRRPLNFWRGFVGCACLACLACFASF